LWAVFDHPPVDRRVIHVDPTFQHAVFDVARAQRVGHIPADAPQHNVWWAMSPFEADRHRLSPPLLHGLEGRPYHKSPQTKTCDRTSPRASPPRPHDPMFSGWGASTWSSTAATSNGRHRPSSKGPWATGRSARPLTAMMPTLASA